MSAQTEKYPSDKPVHVHQKHTFLISFGIHLEKRLSCPADPDIEKDKLLNMAKKSEDIELSSSLDNDLEQGEFPVSSNSNDLNLFKSRFDTLTSGGKRSRFCNLGFLRRKKLIAIILVAFAIVSTITLTYINADSESLKYYKGKISENISGLTGTGTSGSESGNGNGQETSESNEVIYDDVDLEESLKNGNTNSDSKKITPEDTQTDQEQQSENKGKPQLAEETSNEAGQANNPESNKNPDSAQDSQQQEASEGRPNHKKQGIMMNDIRTGKFRAHTAHISFLTPPANEQLTTDEGLYLTRTGKSFEIQKSSDKSFSKTVFEGSDVQVGALKLHVLTFTPNYDSTFAIIQTDRTLVYRHSSVSHYWLYDIKANVFAPLKIGEGDILKLSFAAWSPNYNFITLGYQNNLYVYDLKTHSTTQITNDGSDLILNGVTDWVYEEEVFASDKAFWWAPDESNIIFMKTDETGVPTYNIDYYVQNLKGGEPYPENKKVTYPKPGFKNPEVSLHKFNLNDKKIVKLENRDDSQLGQEYIIYDVFFTTSNDLIVKETDRESNILNYRHYNLVDLSSKIIHQVFAEQEYNGWIEKQIDPVIIPGSNNQENGFIDIAVVEGFNHLVYFKSPSKALPPVPLTSGKFEVLNNGFGYNPETKLFYFASNERSPFNSDIYSVDIETLEVNQVTPTDDEFGYYTTVFSPNAKYAAITYKGPNTPTQKLIEVSTNKDIQMLSTSAMVDVSKLKYKIPKKSFKRYKVDTHQQDQVELNVIEIYPEDFNPKRKEKYPILVHFYAGPGSYTVTSKNEIGFIETVASSLDAIVLYIEPRGTAGQGWKFRSFAKNHIGLWEPHDIISVTNQFIKANEDLVDKESVALWGWSYGGFTTLKTLETDAGQTFKYGMAVAPVTNWLFYDSIYTERYMNKPENNPSGYEISKITNTQNLKKVNRFLIMHGTADDNVHVQNTYSLLDLLDINGNENYDVHLFPDSEHSIYHHNANRIVYDKLFSWLKDAFDGDFNLIGHK